MLDSLRTPIFVVSLIAAGLIVCVELGSLLDVLTGTSNSTAAATAAAFDVSTPGKAIPSLALLDGLMFYSTLLMGTALLIPERIQGRIQGIVSLVVSLLLLLASISAIFIDIALLSLMVSLLLSGPFGTIAYFAIWGHFETDAARTVLTLLMTFKIVFAVCLVLAHQRFLQNKGLVLIIVTSFFANLIIAFLHGFVPGFLVSITDDVAAIVVCILAAIWAVIYLIGGIVSVGKVIL